MRSFWEMHYTARASSGFFEIIGEAAKHVPDGLRNEYPEIPENIRTPGSVDR